MSWRLKKKIFYGLILLTIFIFLISGLIFLLKPKPTCFDNKQNQGETGIDCGGPCLPCEIVNLNLITEKPKIIIYPDNTLDLISKIKNPSEKYGLRKFNYRFIIKGKDTKAYLSGESFIMPLETKYLLAVNLKKPHFKIDSVELEINFSKEDFIETEKKEVQIKLLNYSISQGYFQAEIINNDNIPYTNVEINFILFDIFENIIATLKTNIDYLEPLERKDIILTLPQISKEINQVIIAPYYNFFKEK